MSSLPIQFERQKDKLQNVDGAEELKLEGPVVTDAPDADCNGDDADKDQGHEDDDPEVAGRHRVHAPARHRVDVLQVVRAHQPELYKHRTKKTKNPKKNSTASAPVRSKATAMLQAEKKQPDAAENQKKQAQEK